MSVINPRPRSLPPPRRSPSSLPALAVDSVKMLIPANPGGGWDTTGRELGKAMHGLGRGEERPVRQQGRRGRHHRPRAVRELRQGRPERA